MRGTGRSRLLAIGNATILAAAVLLAGCSGPAGSPGLGGSDGETATPDSSTGPADEAGDRGPVGDEGLAGENGDRPVYVKFTLPYRYPTGTTISAQRIDANCVRDEVEGTWRAERSGIIVVFMFTNSDGQCMWESSWATWRLTVATPGGGSEWTTFEIAQTNTPKPYATMMLEGKCWGEQLQCFPTTSEVQSPPMGARIDIVFK
ncbi:MAG: hypothetical protein BGO95_00795 [Micrococcales bacterium 73-13]|nr:MAG: hypothetical protein BGO95_00795 [Micrococcales bacterium 73-13]